MARLPDLDLYLAALLVLYWRRECASGHASPGSLMLAAAEYDRAVAILAELYRHQAALFRIGRDYRARLAACR